MSYAQRYQRLRQVRSGSRELIAEDDEASPMHNPSTRRGPFHQQEQAGATRGHNDVSLSGHSVDSCAEDKTSGDVVSNDADHRGGKESEHTPSASTLMPQQQHGQDAASQQKHDVDTAPDREEITINVSEALTTNVPPEHQKESMSLPQQRRDGEDRRTQSTPQQRVRKEASESPVGKRPATTPNKVGRRSSRSNSAGTSPAPNFSVTTRVYSQTMPLSPESRKQFKSPHTDTSRPTRPASSSTNGQRNRQEAQPSSPAPAVDIVRTPEEEEEEMPHRGGSSTRHHPHESNNNHSGKEAFTPRSFASSSTVSARRSVEAEVLAARLQAIAQARAEVEQVLHDQGRYENRIVSILANLENDCRRQREELLQQQEEGGQAAPPPDTPTRMDDAVCQAERERDVAIRLLRQFKDEGNAVVQRMYDAVRAREEENVRLLAAQEALQRENKQLRKLFTTSTRKKSLPPHTDTDEDGRPFLNLDDLASSPSSSPTAPETELAALQAQVREQKLAIGELGQLLSTADDTMRALRRRAEVAEAQKHALLLQAASTSLSFLGFTRKGPSPTNGDGAATAAAAAGERVGDDAEKEEEEEMLPSPMQRMLEKNPHDADVANVGDLLRAARARILDLQASLQKEREGRLQAELAAHEIAAENDKAVRLLEERLQRAETPRGLTVTTEVRDEQKQNRPELEALADEASVASENRAGADQASSSSSTRQQQQQPRESHDASAPPPDHESSTTHLTAASEESAKPQQQQQQQGSDSNNKHQPINGNAEEEENTSALSTPTRQLRTAWSDAADLTAGGRGSVKEGESPAGHVSGPSSTSHQHHHQHQPPDQHHHYENAQVEDVVVEEDTTTTVMTDEVTASSHAKRKRRRKRKPNHPRHATAEEDETLDETETASTAPKAPATAQGSASPESAEAKPTNTPTRAVAAQDGHAVSPSSSLPPAGAVAAATNHPAKPPKPAVKAYIGQKSTKEKSSGSGGEGQGGSTEAAAPKGGDAMDVPIRAPLPIPAPAILSTSFTSQGSPNNSFSHHSQSRLGRSGAHANNSPLGSHASRGSSASRRMVLSLSPRGPRDGEEGTE